MSKTHFYPMKKANYVSVLEVRVIFGTLIPFFLCYNMVSIVLQAPWKCERAKTKTGAAGRPPPRALSCSCQRRNNTPARDVTGWQLGCSDTARPNVTFCFCAHPQLIIQDDDETLSTRRARGPSLKAALSAHLAKIPSHTQKTRDPRKLKLYNYRKQGL